MQKPTSKDLYELIHHKRFNETDKLLRSGKNISEDDIKVFQYVSSYYDILKFFYNQFNCELIKKDGYFYLLVLQESDKKFFKTEKLLEEDMLLGFVLAELYLDPEIVTDDYVISLDNIVQVLEPAVSKDLARTIFACHKSRTEVDADNRMVDGIKKSLRKLSRLGFVLKLSPETYRISTPIERFIDIIRASVDESNYIDSLVTKGILCRVNNKFLQPEKNTFGNLAYDNSNQYTLNNFKDEEE